MEGFEGDSLAQNPLLMTCLENDQRFLSKLIPHKILEAIFCRNFVKKAIFLGNFGSELLSEACN